MDNLRHWAALETTNPDHTKPFDRGRFKGTAIKPIENERRMTEHFGPCGIGWGMDKPEFVTMPANEELMVFCTVSLWYRDGGVIGRVYGVGGDKVIKKEAKGLNISDEAYKGAYTDALGNAMKHIGVNADIHMGRFDDSKYVREIRGQFAASDETEAPVTKGATRTAKPHLPAVVPPTPSSTGNGKPMPLGISDFLKRESYEIDPDAVGGWSKWETYYMRIAPHCDGGQLAKLATDNEPHFSGFKGAVRPEVFENMMARLVQILAKFATPDGPLMEEGDVESVLQV